LVKFLNIKQKISKQKNFSSIFIYPVEPILSDDNARRPLFLAESLGVSPTPPYSIKTQKSFSTIQIIILL